MKHSAFEHRAALAGRISTLSRRHQLFFALWCVDRLWSEYSLGAQVRLGAAWSVLAACREKLWDEVWLGIPAEVEKAIEEIQAGVDWDAGGDVVSPEVEELTLGALAIVTALSSVASRSPGFALSAAEANLNCIDYRLGLVVGVSDPSAHPSFESEMTSQFVVLDRLHEGDVTPDVRSWGRTASTQE